MKKILVSLWLLVVLGMLLLTTCSFETSLFQKPRYPRDTNPALTATISSDGKLVAALDRTGTESPRLRIKWVDKDEPWQELPVPMYTDDIRFALKGYDLLMTHALPDNFDKGQLTRWDVSDLTKESQVIHQGPWLAFPLEVRPGEYLVRSCRPTGMDFNQRNKNTCQTKGLGSYWMLLTPGKAPIRVTPKELHPVYRQPNVTDKGFFWVSNYVVGVGPYGEDMTPTKHPMLLAFPFPSGEAPTFEVEHLSPESRIRCDRQLARCLRHYITGTDPKTHLFDFDIEIAYRGRICQPPGLQGYSYSETITANGHAAVISLAPRSSEQLRVVVLKFKDGQCEPTFIQHFYFEEK